MSKPKKRPELAQTETVDELPAACADELAAVEFLEARRWKGCPCCVHCGSVNVYTMRDAASGARNKRFLWRCRDCARQYTVRVGTVMEDSPIPLRHWVRVIWEASSGKNGVSALEVSRKVQVSYKAALFMLHRLRYAMTEHEPPDPKMDGVVEMDETYVGGKPRHKGWTAKRNAKYGKPRDKWTSKVPVVATVQRGGKVRSKVVLNVTAENVAKVIRDNVAPRAWLMTDESSVYRNVKNLRPGKHDRVNHSAKEYVRGDVSTNTRELNDGERVEALIHRTDGRRMTYDDYRGCA